MSSDRSLIPARYREVFMPARHTKSSALSKATTWFTERNEKHSVVPDVAYRQQKQDATLWAKILIPVYITRHNARYSVLLNNCEMLKRKKSAYHEIGASRLTRCHRTLCSHSRAELLSPPPLISTCSLTHILSCVWATCACGPRTCRQASTTSEGHLLQKKWSDGGRRTGSWML